ncbi:MAG: hypothetical protein H0V49_01620 [Nocardioidaceae bacterium]|nr:hypothetical protein [Nocardioidaceae bacterium]
MTLVAARARQQRALASGWVSEQLTRRQSIVVGGGFALLGALSAVFAALVSRHVWRPDELMLPWGVGLAVVGSVAVVLTARTLGKGHGLGAAGGWLVGLLLVLSGPGGDIVVAGDLLGYAFLLGATAAVAITAGWPQQRL